MFRVLLTTLTMALTLQAYEGQVQTVGTTDMQSGGNDIAYDIALQKDGKIILAGATTPSGSTDFAFGLARYNSDGSLDTTFGSGSGKNINNYDGTESIAYGVAVANDGTIITVGMAEDDQNSNYDFLIQRSDRNGNLVQAPFALKEDFSGNFDGARDVAIGVDGKAVVVGTTMNNATRHFFAIARYTLLEGSLEMQADATFSGDGKIVQSIGESDDRAEAVAIDRLGKIVVAGTTRGSVTHPSSGLPIDATGVALVRYNSDGTLDSAFDTDGIVTVLSATYNDFRVADVLIQKDGKIVVGGSVTVGQATDLYLLRFNDDGSLDQTFGQGGFVHSDANLLGDESVDTLNGLTLTCNGKIIAAGSTRCLNIAQCQQSRSLLARYLADGSLDTSFGVEGMMSYVSGTKSALYGVAVQHDGSIVSGGTSESKSNYNFLMMQNESKGCVNPSLLMYLLN